jgi:hypothetical protein
MVLDLDQQMERYGNLPDFYQLLARESRIDPYSYQYEVLESSELEFAAATGLAAEHLDNGHFDVGGFQQRWHEQQHLGILQEIAQRLMGVDNLEQQPELKAALLEAFAAGRDKH